MELKTACQVIRELEPNQGHHIAHGFAMAADHLADLPVVLVGGKPHVSLEHLVEVVARAGQIPAELARALMQQIAVQAGGVVAGDPTGSGKVISGPAPATAVAERPVTVFFVVDPPPPIAAPQSVTVTDSSGRVLFESGSAQVSRAGDPPPDHG